MSVNVAANSTKSRWMMMFSAFDVWAAEVKLKLPFWTDLESTIRTLLCCILTAASIRTGMPFADRKLTILFRLSRLPLCSLSTTTRTSTPRFFASTNARPIGFDVRPYAATLIDCCASLINRTVAAVQPPLGEKATSTVPFAGNLTES